MGEPVLDLAPFDVVAAPFGGGGAPRAIIDIGSNTVRLVIYGGPARAPVVLHNEKVTARLGKGVAENGKLGAKAMAQALAALGRYVCLLRLRGVDDVQTVATAAVRDASNGAVFLGRIAALGLSPRLLSGEEEALTSARGVMAAFPGAVGMVGDLGGGSLELIDIHGTRAIHGISLPLGTLRLPGLRAGGGAKFARRVRKMLAAAVCEDGVDWSGAHAQDFYLVGGSWRAFGRFAMLRGKWPVDDPHGFVLTAEQALRVARSLREGHFGPAPVGGIKAAGVKAGKPAARPLILHPLAEGMQVSASRLASLPDAAALLEVLVRELKPARLIFSSWGLREGVLASGFEPGLAEVDPMLAGVTAFAQGQGAGGEDVPATAALVAAWTADVDPAQGAAPNLRLAATMLALASMRTEPNLRPELAANWALRKRWIGISDEGRACLALAVLANNGRTAIPPDLLRLASASRLREAVAWGIATRLCRRFCGPTAEALAGSALFIDGLRVVLAVRPDLAPLVNEPVEKDLRLLAECLGLGHEVRLLSPN